MTRSHKPAPPEPAPQTETRVEECHHTRWLNSIGSPSVCLECGATFDDKRGWIVPLRPRAPQTERHVFRCWQDDLRGSVIHPDHTPERCREQGHHCNVCHLSFDDPVHQPASEKEE